MTESRAQSFDKCAELRQSAGVRKQKRMVRAARVFLSV